MNFIKFRDAVNQQFSEMAKEDLFRTNINKDILWEHYLNSFPEGTNPIFKERTVHDCQCCKQFIRSCGDVVCISADLKIHTIWDVITNDEYTEVAKSMSNFIKAHSINNKFLHWQKYLGICKNFGIDGTIWDHFYFDLPKKFVNTKNLDSKLAEAKANAQVFYRGIDEISGDAIKTALDLIKQKTIYRGEEHKDTIENFQKLKNKIRPGTLTIKQLEKFSWKYADKPGARIRNTAIGTLLIDISEGMNLDKAVRLFENKMYGYKRPTAVIYNTPAMIKKAQEKIIELGFTNSILRKNAKLEDLTINNVIWADRSIKTTLDVFEEMVQEASGSKGYLKKIETVDIKTFINNILPTAENVDILFENKHENNLMSLVAPLYPDSPGMFKWGNNFSWSYNGDNTDSIKKRVKRAGGNIDAVLRCSLAWNNYDDLDIHVIEPKGGSHIYYNSRGKKHKSSGMLDVDMNAGHGSSIEPVENIIWTDKSKMLEGKYELYVHQYQRRESENYGFTIELEFEGKIHTFHYPKPINTGNKIPVATFSFSKKSGIKFHTSLNSEESSKILWGLGTEKFQKVQMVMNSPNHWDGEKTGNKHYFFIMENCDSDKPVRGFYNEFLNENLTEHRKVLEVLGSKMKTDPKKPQLSGLGFSSTKQDSIIVKITGSFTRTLKVTF